MIEPRRLSLALFVAAAVGALPTAHARQENDKSVRAAKQAAVKNSAYVVVLNEPGGPEVVPISLPLFRELRRQHEPFASRGTRRTPWLTNANAILHGFGGVPRTLLETLDIQTSRPNARLLEDADVILSERLLTKGPRAHPTTPTTTFWRLGGDGGFWHKGRYRRINDAYLGHTISRSTAKPDQRPADLTDVPGGQPRRVGRARAGIPRFDSPGPDGPDARPARGRRRRPHQRRHSRGR